MTIEMVAMPNDAEAVRWAGTLNDPGSGVLVVYFPPSAQSVTAFARELLAALGKSVGDGPDGLSTTEATELCLAWLAGYRISEVIVPHAEWMRSDLVEPISALATLANVDLTLLLSQPTARLDGWAREQRGWTAFVADAAERGKSATPPALRASSLPISGLGALGERRPIQAAFVRPGEATAAYLDMAACIRRDGRTRLAVVRSFAQVLRRFGESTDARDGAGVAAAQGGWEVWATTGGEFSEAKVGPTWGDLSESFFPHQSAAVAVLAAGMWPREAVRLTVADVAPDGTQVRSGGVQWTVPSGGVPFVRALARLRAIGGAAPTDPYFVHRRRVLSPHALAVAVEAQLHTLGLKISLASIEGKMSPSERWLARRGLGLVERSSPEDASIVKDRVCRHGLPEWITVDGVRLSHSQRLCRGNGPAETRHEQVRPRDAGYELEVVDETDQGRVYAVTQNGTSRGQLVSVSSAVGQIWIQIGCGIAPTVDRIHDTVRGAVSTDLPT